MKKNVIKLSLLCASLCLVFFINQSFNSGVDKGDVMESNNIKLEIVDESEKELGLEYCRYRLGQVTSFVQLPDPTPIWLQNGGVICLRCPGGPNQLCPAPFGAAYDIYAGNVLVGEAVTVTRLSSQCQPCGRFEGLNGRFVQQ